MKCEGICVCVHTWYVCGAEEKLTCMVAGKFKDSCIKG